MEKGQKPMKISTRLLMVSGIFLILTCAFVVALVNHSMKQQALVDAESKMRMMADQYFAIHSYFSQRLKPAIFKLTDPIRSKEYFEPSWMSSTYAVREITKYIISNGSDEYYLKDAAINARSPENEASPLEKEFISALNANPKLENKSTVQLLDGNPYLILLRRGELMEESCLRCHGSPDQAPGDMVRYYGPERSFNRKAGDVVSAISIRVPLSSAYATANRLSFKLSGLLLTLILALFGVFSWLNNRLVFKPLSMIHKKALEISTSEKHLGEEIPLPSGRELNELTAAFNNVSIRLRHHVDHLEELVKDRTDELLKTTYQLEQRIKDYNRVQEVLQKSEERYKGLFKNMGSGVAIYEVKGDAEDFIFLDFNEAAEKIDMQKKEGLLGRSIFEARPGVEEFGLIDAFREVWKTGKPKNHPTTLYQDEKIKAWYENFVYKLPSGEIVAIFTNETERKQAEELLRQSEEKYRQLFNTVPDAVMLLDGKTLQFIDANASALNLYGYSREEFLKLKQPETSAQYEVSVHTLLKILGGEINKIPLRYHKKKDGTKFPVEVSAGNFMLEGRPVVFLFARDITERKLAEKQTEASLKEKEVLLSEIHHRVKNNMQVIISLFRLQAGKIKNKKPADLFKEGEARIKSMALIHEQLYQSKEFAQIDFGKYVKNLVNDLFVSHGVNTNRIKLDIEIENIRYDIESAIPCGLIINELVSNALKHAFPQGKEGKINIALRPLDEDEFELTVSDDGVGIPKDMDLKNTDTMGLHLVNLLSERQLDGKIELNRTQGTQFKIKFKRANYKPRI